jgi:hypothetical protein
MPTPDAPPPTVGENEELPDGVTLEAVEETAAVGAESGSDAGSGTGSDATEASTGAEADA